ncbi:MAG: NAD-dependent epimerase/dehydratase family protein [Thermodesulfobacteriota bacterium]
MTRKVLITGGLGYVGSRVAQALMAQPGLHVTICDRRPLANPPAWLQAADTLIIDLLAADDLTSVCRGCWCIVHLAAPNEIDSASDPLNALLVNGAGTLKLLEAAQRAGVERFVYFSTAHIYGAPLAGSITEQTLPRPVHPYSITHRVAEDFVLAARDQGKIQGMVFRLSNGFGAPAHAEVNRWTLVVNDLCRQAVTDGVLVLHSSGLQRRDFITLTDVANAVTHFLNLPVAAWSDGLFNLGGGCSLRILDVAELVARRAQEVLGIAPPIQRPDPGRGEEPQALAYSIDKLKATGFSLSQNFDEEIDATLRFCQAFSRGQ